MSVGTVLAVFGLLPCAAAAMCTSNIALLLGFGLHLVIFAAVVAGTTAPDNSTLDDGIYVVSLAHRVAISGGKDVCR